MEKTNLSKERICKQIKLAETLITIQIGMSKTRQLNFEENKDFKNADYCKIHIMGLEDALKTLRDCINSDTPRPLNQVVGHQSVDKPYWFQSGYSGKVKVLEFASLADAEKAALKEACLVHIYSDKEKVKSVEGQGVVQ
ncbi:MAG: hypothetical protein V6Z89_14400 [Desulfobacter sp.]